MTVLIPDFDSIQSEDVLLPYDETRSFTKLTFSDPLLKGHQLLVIEDSVAPTAGDENRLTTFAVTFPRAILAEANTHRVWSRNSASSRARSVRATVQAVMDNPYVPVYTRNQKGMAGSWGTQAQQDEATRLWLKGRDRAVVTVLELILGEKHTKHLSESNVHDVYLDLIDAYSELYNSDDDSDVLSTHKQYFNRVMEPYQWHEAVVTSSYWQNFINLRNHVDADPAIHGPAALIDRYLTDYAPVERWAHLPFIADADRPTLGDSWDTLKPVFLRSSGEAAQISYHDKSSAAKTTATAKLGDRLLDAGHYSPFEHSAIVAAEYVDLCARTPELPTNVTSNFDESWIQFRPMIAGITK